MYVLNLLGGGGGVRKGHSQPLKLHSCYFDCFIRTNFDYHSVFVVVVVFRVYYYC